MLLADGHLHPLQKFPPPRPLDACRLKVQVPQALGHPAANPVPVPNSAHLLQVHEEVGVCSLAALVFLPCRLHCHQG